MGDHRLPHPVQLTVLSLMPHFLFFPGEKFKVETKVIAADFGKPAEIYDHIATGLKGLEIGVLGK